MKGMQERMTKMEEDNKEQHHLKHQAVQEQTKYQMLLGTIIVLAEDCTCGALDKVQSFMDRLDPTKMLGGTTTGPMGPMGPQGPPGVPGVPPTFPGA